MKPHDRILTQNNFKPLISYFILYKNLQEPIIKRPTWVFECYQNMHFRKNEPPEMKENVMSRGGLVD